MDRSRSGRRRDVSEWDCTRSVPSLLVIQGTLLLSVKNGVVLSPCKVSPAMSENNRIDPLSAAYTTPIDRSDLHHLLQNHEPTAAVAAICLNARPRTHDLAHSRSLLVHVLSEPTMQKRIHPIEVLRNLSAFMRSLNDVESGNSPMYAAAP